jgi:hypothetical protein
MAEAQAGNPSTMMAGLRPELVWQRTSPKSGSVEGPVFYQLIFRSSATPGNIPAIAGNFTLKNSPIAVTGSGVQVSGDVQTSGHFIGDGSRLTNLPGGGGTVTSVGLAAPASDFVVSGSPVSNSGTLSLNWNVAPTDQQIPNAIVKRNFAGDFSARIINVGVLNAAGGIRSTSNGDGIDAQGGANAAGGSFAGGSNGNGIEAFAGAGGLAGTFSGNVSITGNLSVTGTVSKTGGSFKIDHPVDPANKYLSHSFVESPDMMNIYNGNVVTDGHGIAWVELPGYFTALNRDFRYQLTVIGVFAQAIVAQKINSNHFMIKTSKPNIEVSWQVTGIRQDAYANAHRIAVEEDKPADERGHYLHPELFGQEKEKTVGWVGRPPGR